MTAHKSSSALVSLSDCGWILTECRLSGGAWLQYDKYGFLGNVWEIKKQLIKASEWQFILLNKWNYLINSIITLSVRNCRVMWEAPCYLGCDDIIEAHMGFCAVSFSCSLLLLQSNELVDHSFLTSRGSKMIAQLQYWHIINFLVNQPLLFEIVTNYWFTTVHRGCCLLWRWWCKEDFTCKDLRK